MAADSPTPRTHPDDVSLLDESVATAPPSVGGRTVREVVLSAEVRALRCELERRERRSQRLVDQYETLLDVQADAARGDDAFVWSTVDDRQGDPPSASGLLDRLRGALPSFRRRGMGQELGRR